MKTRRLATFALGGSLLVGMFVACNVFTSLEACSSDSDCPSSSMCDPEGRFCITVDAAIAVDAMETSVVDASDGGVDAPVDVYVPKCDPSAPFTRLSLVKGFEERQSIAARITNEELSVLFSATNGCEEESCYDLWVADRPSINASFGEPRVVPAVNCDMASEYWPTLSADAKLIFFESSRAAVPIGGACSRERARIWTATRENVATEFGAPRIDSVFNHGAQISDSAPYLHPSGRSLYFTSDGRVDGGGQEIFVAQISAIGFLTSVDAVSALNTSADESFAVVSLDDRTLYFGRSQPNDGEPDHFGNRDVWVSTRDDVSHAFGTPRIVSELTTSDDELPGTISNDQCRLYFTSNRVFSDAGAGDGGPTERYRLWVAEREPK